MTSSGTTNFSSQEGAFSVYFPAKPVLRRKTSGPNRQVRYACKIGTVMYAVDAAVITPSSRPEEMNTPAKLKKGFDYIQTNLIKRMGGKLETSRDVVLDGVPGRWYRAATHRGQTPVQCTMHMYMAPNYSYILMAMGFTKDCQAQRAHIERFLGSFRPTAVAKS